MIRSTLLLLTFIFALNVTAQTDSSHLRISMLTCGTGPEIWETFGHTAIRVTDSVRGTDNVYNYGTFNGYDEGFELNFMRGKLLYYLSYYPYTDFVQEYDRAGRSMQEQLLLIDSKKKQEIFSFLQWNALNENKYYKYDFFFDNCATRIRDVFPKTYGDDFKFGRTLPADSKLSFRDIINQYFYREHFVRFGVNLLLGSKIDKRMSNEDIMFLPDYLEKGVGGATLKGTKIAGTPVVILDGAPVMPATVNWVFICTLAFSLLIIISLLSPSLKSLGSALSNFLLFITGLVGVLMFVMWFGTDHQGCSNNYNLLWALPTNIFLAFARKRRKDKYAVMAIILILVALLLHILRIQQMPLLELSPLLIALLFTYGMIYKRNKIKDA